MNKKQNIILYCFSPLVMLTTFLIEACAAGYILVKYRAELASRLIISMLSFLALFQFAEYMVCQNSLFLSSFDWARIGYASITMLPPLGIHLGLTIAKQNKPTLLKAAYGSALLFMILFSFIGQGAHSEQCLGNYVLFRVAPHIVWPYIMYYYGWLMAGIYVFMTAREQLSNVRRKQALLWLSVGYLSFMVPTTVVNIIDPKTIAGIPSIMCGFAVMLALCLLFKVAPLVLENTNELNRSESKN